jgi:hypothetical protein
VTPETWSIGMRRAVIRLFRMLTLAMAAALAVTAAAREVSMPDAPTVGVTE